MRIRDVMEELIEVPEFSDFDRRDKLHLVFVAVAFAAGMLVSEILDNDPSIKPSEECVTSDERELSAPSSNTIHPQSPIFQ